MCLKKSLRRKRLLHGAVLPCALLFILAGIANLTSLLFTPVEGTSYIEQSVLESTPSVQADNRGFWQAIPSIDTSQSPAATEQTPAHTQAVLSTDFQVTPPVGMGPIEQLTMTASMDNRTIGLSAGYIWNLTSVPNSGVAEAAAQQPSFFVEPYSDEPQVLIYHTHGTESYDPEDLGYYDPAVGSRSADKTQNIVAVGAVMTEVLNSAGINTIHDTTLHDEFSYNGSYDASAMTVQQYLAQYPSIKVVLDVHRDALQQSDGTRLKPVTLINGEKTAQVMLISGADDGTMGMPNYLQNLAFASAYQTAMESMYPTFTRPILFDYRNYNQQLSTGALLLEVGGHANTLDEALRAGKYAAQALAELLLVGW